MVEHPSMYYWSSYSYYAKGKRDDIITPNPLYETLGGSEVDRQSAYKDYVNQARPYENLVDKALFA